MRCLTKNFEHKGWRLRESTSCRQGLSLASISSERPLCTRQAPCQARSHTDKPDHRLPSESTQFTWSGWLGHTEASRRRECDTAASHNGDLPSRRPWYPRPLLARTQSATALAWDKRRGANPSTPACTPKQESTTWGESPATASGPFPAQIQVPRS